jgi:hypothetical protein
MCSGLISHLPFITAQCSPPTTALLLDCSWTLLEIRPFLALTSYMHVSRIVFFILSTFSLEIPSVFEPSVRLTLALYISFQFIKYLLIILCVCSVFWNTGEILGRKVLEISGFLWKAIIWILVCLCNTQKPQRSKRANVIYK